MDEHAQVQIDFWQRINVVHLCVAPELLGAKHEFNYRGASITVGLPTEDVESLKTIDAVIRDEDDPRAFIYSWKEAGGRPIPVSIALGDVDITVQLPGVVKLTTALTDGEFNLRQASDEHDMQVLAKLEPTAAEMVAEAFEQWAGVLRWKTGSSSVCSGDSATALGGLQPYFRLRATNKLLSSGSPKMLTVYLAHTISVYEWAEAAAALDRGEQSPLYFNLYFDGRERMKHGDLQQAVVDYAIAVEVFLRSKVMGCLPSDLRAAPWKYLDDANIRQFVEHFFPEQLNDVARSEYKVIKSGLHKLFDVRNIIIHSGTVSGLTPDSVQGYRKTVEGLLAFDKHPEYWA